MSMIPGLHPNTRPQRKGEQGAWALAAPVPVQLVGPGHQRHSTPA